ncbi:MAG: hypothetical protein M1381_09855 [Deltaproteobacteria bacterium]|nr:hypothetical protein [Deltaproteobacteria bacterium]
MNLIIWTKNLFKFIGNTNAPVDSVNKIDKALIISKIDKASILTLYGNKSKYTGFIAIIETIIWFIVLEVIIGNSHSIRTMLLFGVLYFCCFLVFQVVLQTKYVGDTVIIFEDKIMALNWLYAKETLWSGVKEIHIYPKYLTQDIRENVRSVFEEKPAKVVWVNIKIRTNENKVIRINTAYSHNDEILNYIKEKHKDKIIINDAKGMLVNREALLAIVNGFIIGPFVVGMVYLLNYCIGLIVK